MRDRSVTVVEGNEAGFDLVQQIEQRLAVGRRIVVIGEEVGVGLAQKIGCGLVAEVHPGNEHRRARPRDAQKRAAEAEPRRLVVQGIDRPAGRIAGSIPFTSGSCARMLRRTAAIDRRSSVMSAGSSRKAVRYQSAGSRRSSGPMA
jgi:hypothetical protein